MQHPDAQLYTTGVLTYHTNRMEELDETVPPPPSLFLCVYVNVGVLLFEEGEGKKEGGVRKRFLLFLGSCHAIHTPHRIYFLYI